MKFYSLIFCNFAISNYLKKNISILMLMDWSNSIKRIFDVAVYIQRV